MRFAGFVLGFMLSGQVVAGQMSLVSQDVAAGKMLASQQVFNSFGCQGENISPRLSWTFVPQGTKSFAVTVYDPDAPTGSGWWHWVMVNIPADVRELPANAGNPEAGLAPRGSQNIRTDFGSYGYGGPCPPAGDKPHRYQFTVYALDTDKLTLPADATAALAGFYIHAHTLDSARLEALYAR